MFLLARVLEEIFIVGLSIHIRHTLSMLCSINSVLIVVKFI